MPGYGFCRVEVYARKSRSKDRNFRNVQQVLDEVERVPGNAPHVENPKEPRVVDGCSLEELRAEHDTIEDAVQGLSGKSAGKTRKIRSTQNSLACAVLSYPIPVSDLKKSKKAQDLYLSWRDDAVQFMKREFGQDYRCAVQHLDEKFGHVHVYALRDDFDAKMNHPGYRAQKEAIAQGKTGKEAEIAGAYALREFLDRYHEEVGKKYGFERFGPKRERLSRKAWVERQRSADKHSENLRERANFKAKVRNEVAAEWAKETYFAKRKISRGAVDAVAVEAAIKEQVDAVELAYANQFRNAEDAIDKSSKKAMDASDQNKVLKAENLKLSAESHGYEMRMAQMEMVMTETVHGLRDVAYDTGSEKAYGKLSAACQHVSEVHEADRNVFTGLISDVREICSQVKKHVPQVFRKFFGWTPEQKAEQEARQREVERIREQTRRRDNTRQNAAPSARPQFHSP